MGLASLVLPDATRRCLWWPCREWSRLAYCRTLLPLLRSPLGERLIVSPSSTYTLRVVWQETVTCTP